LSLGIGKSAALSQPEASKSDNDGDLKSKQPSVDADRRPGRELV
jgi:hypothetical protein